MSLPHLHLLLTALTSLWPSPHPISWLGGWGFPVSSALPWVPGKGGCSEGLGSLQLVTWLIETEVDRWLVKIGLVAPSQRNLADLTTPGFPHPLFPLGTGTSLLTPTESAKESKADGSCHKESSGWSWGELCSSLFKVARGYQS